ncbi:MAG: hypothetical protein R3345_15150, partial [Fulvivirga sp.]|nr:hypothetical protein [Fulvivirga sp.]
EYLGDDLVAIGRLGENYREDQDLHNQKAEAYAILDLLSEEVITPWYSKIEMVNKNLNLIQIVPLKDIRKKLNKN